MSIRIDAAACIGCGRCTEICPGSLILRGADGKARLRDVRDCWGCTSCLKECPVHAIRFYLGADIGGRGSELHTEQQGNILHWIIDLPDGTRRDIPVNQKESNRY
ncbi:MAG: ferredoxin family protein [Oscillospiraceae bacterium]|nr:ferredoxin family protein [Oscillospiraceae bacterium]